MQHEEIKNIGTQVTPRYYQGKVVGIHAVAKASYKGVDFEIEQEWDVPAERQVYAEYFTGKEMGEELAVINQETGLQMRLMEKIWRWQIENEPESD